MQKRILSIVLSFVLLFCGIFQLNTYTANYLFFDSFETKFTTLPNDWTFFSKGENSTVSIETSNASDGNYSVRLTDTSTTSGIGVQSKMFSIQAGMEYTVYADFYNYSGSGSIYIKYYDDAGNQVGSKSSSNSTLNGWYGVSVSNVSPTNAVKANVIIYISISGIGNLLFDNIRVLNTHSLSNTVTNPPVQSVPVQSQLITPNGNSLNYSAYNEQGDKLSDYSYAGFYAGQMELPDVAKLPVSATIFPSTDPSLDDTTRIQEVINSVATTVDPGKMVVVKLLAGRYNINKNGLTVKSGIVLLGEGQGPNGTVIYATDALQYSVIKTTGSAPTMVGNKVYLTDQYVKAGSKEIHVSEADVSSFSVGDTISIYHPCTTEWVGAMGMGQILNVYETNTSWKAGSVDSITERTITAIEGNTIQFDFPLFVPLDQNYAKTYIYKINDSKRTSNFGIENLRLESYYNGTATDEEHSNVGININYSKNGFVRNVSAKYFVLSAVRCGSYTKQVTVQNCSSLEPISQIAGSRRYSFSCSSNVQQVLFTGCYSYSGRHDYMASYTATGPLAFVDNVVDSSNTASETHGNWTTGLLYDNVYQIGAGSKGFFAFANRGIYGTALSQGWSSAGSLAWNSLSSTFISHKPPLTYQNFLIGIWGNYTDLASANMKASNISSYKGIYRTSTQTTGFDANFATSTNTPFVGDAYFESPTAPVEPRSIMKAQLAQRITGNFKNLKPNAPIIISPRSEEVLESTNFSATGLFQMGAEKVTVYVDDHSYTASLNQSDYTFSCNLNLEEGYHKIYVTQTINGVESTKNADRFIKIGTTEEADNPSYLSSTYSVEQTALITNDTRQTYDEYLLTSTLGTAENPYLITNQASFEAIANDPDAYYKLANNITLTNYKPIPFCGTLYADALTTIHLSISSLGSNVGLFSTVSGTVSIDHIRLTGLVSGASNVGGLIGLADGVTKLTISNCVNEASISASGNIAGGLIGRSDGTLNQLTLSNCKNIGNITANYYAGGLGGLLSGSIKASANSGEIKVIESKAGGITGWMCGGTIQTSYNMGKVSGKEILGGIIGFSQNLNCLVTDCYNTGNVTASETGGLAGAIVGQVYTFSVTASNFYTVGTVSGSKGSEFHGSGNFTGTKCYYLDINGDEDTNSSSITLSVIKTLTNTLGSSFVASANNYSFPQLKDNINTTAYHIYTVTVTQPKNGSITPSGIFYVPLETELTISAVANKGYTVDYILINGTKIFVNQFTKTINEDISIGAEIIEIPEKSKNEIISEISTFGNSLLTPVFQNGEVIATQNGNYTMNSNLSYRVVLATVKDFNGWTLKDYGVNVDGVNYSAGSYIKNYKYGVMFYGAKIRTDNNLIIKMYAIYENNKTNEVFTVYGNEVITKITSQL